MPKKTALIVVDLQNDFLPAGALAVADSNQVLPRINSILVSQNPWSLVIATQDWHPDTHILFASQHGLEPFSEKYLSHPEGALDPTKGTVQVRQFTLWPDHCVQNTRGADLDQSFEMAFTRLAVPTAVVRKGYLQDREYYLCFADCWKLHKTECESLLRKHNITNVVFVGLAYDYCVLNSAIDCAEAGFSTYVVKDCCKSVDPSNIKQTDAAYRAAGIKILQSTLDIPNSIL